MSSPGHTYSPNRSGEALLILSGHHLGKAQGFGEGGSLCHKAKRGAKSAIPLFHAKHHHIPVYPEGGGGGGGGDNMQ